MDATETTSSCSTSQTDDGEDLPNDAVELQTKNDSLIAELESLRDSHRSLQSRSAETEDKLAVLQHQNDEALSRNTELLKTIEQVLEERENLRDELRNKIDEESKEKERIRTELDDSSERIRDLSDKIRVFLDQLETLKSAKECLVSMIESVDENRVEIVVDEDEELGEFSGEVRAISELARRAETKLSEYQELRKKEKRELENSVVSLTEENRDINTLLRIALVEKEAVEKSLNKLKGNNNDQKRVALLQIAERGLQRVGFGFMMGAGANEPASDNLGANMGNKSDGSECDEEVVSLASTVERIMKNLRLEITQLRRSLEESRSDTERLQSLTEKQSQKIAENALYIKELEDRETMLAQNVEELLIEIKETEEEIARWREACELEVEAGKIVVEERDKVVSILKQELEKTKAALDISNGKLKLKEELAAAAMAAQAAAERSLQLADSRTAGLNARIEELTRQLEEPESRERTRRKVRHICWPWRALKVNSATSTNSTVQKMIPEMQALLL